MKQYFFPALNLTFVMLLICTVAYFGVVYFIGKLAAGNGTGEKIISNGSVVGYEKIGQKFTDDKYFWGRPSAVDYNAAGSGGSNKGPSNPDYLKIVEDRIDSFLVHNPGIRKEEIPSEMVTASGSGLDPHISPASAFIQVKRIAKVRGLNEEKLNLLIKQHVEKNPIGPDLVHVLKLNLQLDKLKN